MKIIDKILFCLRITDDMPSFFRLVINSKKLSRSKSRHIRSNKANSFFSINIRFKNLSQKIFLRTYTGDIDIFYEVFHKEIYSSDGNIKDAATVVDLGANIGLSALYFLASYPQSKIICVEPGEENFKMLLKNLQSQIARNQVEAIQAAVLDIDGMAFFEDGKMHYNGKVSKEGIENIHAISLPTLFTTHNIRRIDILKIDVEGSEKEIFEGDINWLSIVQHLLLETHSDGLRITCLALLRDHKYKVSTITKDPRNENLFLAVKI